MEEGLPSQKGGRSGREQCSYAGVSRAGRTKTLKTPPSWTCVAHDTSIPDQHVYPGGRSSCGAFDPDVRGPIFCVVSEVIFRKTRSSQV